MKIKLSKSVISNGQVEDYDVRQIKKALNRLGYYRPFEKVGITGIPDLEMFESLKAFQLDNHLFVSGQVRPHDETLKAINRKIAVKPDGQYIWRSVGDNNVRDTHAEYNGTIRGWSDHPDPGEEFNCRCWADAVDSSIKKTNCDAERENYAGSQSRVKELSKKLNDLLLRMNDLREEHNRLLKNAEKSLGTRFVTWLLTLPFDRIGIPGELIQRYFDGIISDQLIKVASNFMQQVWAIKHKIKYLRGQRDITLAQLELASKELEEARERLEKCEENGT